jgi:septum formation protein
MTILLASKSPRRQQLIKEMGFEFQIVHQDIEESYPEEMPAEEVAEYLACLKAAAVEGELQTANQVILASDTTVVLDGEIFGKPTDKADAQRILRALSGKTHAVITGVCLQTLSEKISFSETTFVHFLELSPAEIDYYIESCQPYDKAGAYAIQEWIGLNKIEKIDGSYFNVVGLPTHRVYKAIQSLGILK